MGLATRCTACGTVFRVVRDQLKVSEGWVRCGRCDEVFNATELLFDLNDAEAATDSTAPADSVLPDEDTRDTTGHGSTTARRLALHEVLRNDAPAAPDQPLPIAPLLGTPTAPAELDLASAIDLDPPPPPADPAAEIQVAPEFLRDAERRARWEQPPMRRALSIGAGVLAVALLWQIAIHQRDSVAARWPAALPLLRGSCALFGCRIEPLRRIEDIAVESTALTRAATPDALRLVVVLRNHGAWTLALPWVELSMTDPTGELVTRRALGPQDFRAASPTIAPGADTTLQVLLAAGSSRITGYTVEIFYP